MPEIGATLREARMRARIDISEVEAETKIRAKYLRALENEEWDLLPGPTYTRSFLRAYADFMGLDSKLLVEEYRLSHDRASDHELPPISSAGMRERRQRGGAGGGPRGPGRATLAVLAFVAIVVIIAVVNFASGGGGSDEPSHPQAASNTQASKPPRRHPARPRRRTAPATPSKVSLRLVPSAPVWVCLVDAKQHTRIAGETLQPGQASPTFHSRSFRMRLGNASVTLVVNGRRRTLPASPNPLGYAVTPRALKQLPESKWPACG